MTEADAEPVADLHVHTTASDGQLTVADIPAIARRAGLSAVAITDHDRLHPELSNPIERRDGLTIVRGIELKVEPTDGERLDLLGYAASETAALARLLDGLQTDRVQRATRMVACVEERLDVTLDIELRQGIGRPHVARAIDAHPETAHDAQSAFDTLIGDDGPCYVPRDVPTLETGLETLTDACRLVAVAHPLRYTDVDRALTIATRVGAVERWYPYGADVDEERVARAVAANDLLPTGGSDAHDANLGRAGPDRRAYRRFRETCGID